MRYAIWLAALAVALSGCGMTSAPTEMAADCKRPADRIVDYIPGGRIVITPHEDIDVCDRNVVLTWELHRDAKARYEFHADSIEIRDPDNEFLNCKAGSPGDLDAGKKKIKCTDKNAKHGQPGGPRPYKYTIRVYEINGGSPVAEWDPIIANN